MPSFFPLIKPKEAVTMIIRFGATVKNDIDLNSVVCNRKQTSTMINTVIFRRIAGLLFLRRLSSGLSVCNHKYMLNMLEIYDRCDQSGLGQIIGVNMNFADIADQQSLYIL